MVSKVHAIIYGTDNTLAIADNQSKNHTYVNGERITMPHVLNPGDVIRVGRTEFQVTYGIS
jgi:pSer/pThr/pTyr-binding forkhead associated (FHA) protein